MSTTSHRPSLPIRIGLIREGKVPPDSRVALSPSQAARLDASPEFDVVVQPSPGRCFDDSEYAEAGVRLQEDLGDRDVLIGVKEVPVAQLIPGKTYFFFSHTHKEQAYNRGLLQAVLDEGVRLIDYELLADEKGARYIAFGRFAGMVGAHHGLRAWGLRSSHYDLPQMNTFTGYEAAKGAYAKTDFGELRVVVTGTGRVGQGAVEVLADAGFRQLSTTEFLTAAGVGAVFTQVGVDDYVNPTGRPKAPVDKAEFYAHPGRYESNFLRFTRVADVMVHGIFWDSRAPAMFTTELMSDEDFRIRVISDVTCDIAPVTSIPATLRASTIAQPYFGFDPERGEETAAFAEGSVTMCTIDNLPNEMPRDASVAFGEMFLRHIAGELTLANSALLERATIAQGGDLTVPFSYLRSFLDVGHSQ